jgi:hypothetical protein
MAGIDQKKAMSLKDDSLVTLLLNLPTEIKYLLVIALFLHMLGVGCKFTIDNVIYPHPNLYA